MPRYLYQAFDGRGNQVSGGIDADTREGAVVEIRRQGLYPTEVVDPLVRENEREAETIDPKVEAEQIDSEMRELEERVKDEDWWFLPLFYVDCALLIVFLLIARFNVRLGLGASRLSLSVVLLLVLVWVVFAYGTFRIANWFQHREKP